jgi:plasmid maintenance system killer protein
MIYLFGKVFLGDHSMEIGFHTSKAAKLFNSENNLRAEYGPRMAGLIQQRLKELSAAENLEQMRTLPRANCHELVADRAGKFAVNLAHPYRLIFKPDHDPVPIGTGGGIDWSQVTKIEYVEIDDYHRGH